MSEYILGISKAPDDPVEKKKWVEHWKRVQIALWIDGDAECEMCTHKYKSVDDFIHKDVRWGGIGKFVCGECWPLYEQLAGLEEEK